VSADGLKVNVPPVDGTGVFVLVGVGVLAGAAEGVGVQVRVGAAEGVLVGVFVEVGDPPAT
jgi:hypothetical protein